MRLCVQVSVVLILVTYIDCTCLPGYTEPSPGAACTPCAEGTYKSNSGTAACSMCAVGWRAGGVGETECFCGEDKWNRCPRTCEAGEYLTDQENGDLLRLLRDKRPFSVNIFADYDPEIKACPDRTSNGNTVFLNGHNSINDLPVMFDQSGFNAVNPVKSLMGWTHSRLRWRQEYPHVQTTCWVTRYHSSEWDLSKAILDTNDGKGYLGHKANSRRAYVKFFTKLYSVLYVAYPYANAQDWLIQCMTNGRWGPDNSIMDQTSVGETTGGGAPTWSTWPNHLHVNSDIDTASEFHIHSLWQWDQELSADEMRVVTAALRKELGGVTEVLPETPAAPLVIPVKDLLVYNQNMQAMLNNQPIFWDSCAACRPGTISTTPVSTTCVDCPAGKYQNSSGAHECIPCGAGVYSNSTGSTQCFPCPSTTTSYDNAIGNKFTDCFCMPGSYSHMHEGCTPCPVNTYKTTWANEECTSCPLHTISPPGSMQLSDCICSIGYSQNQNGLACIECEEGTFKDSEGAIECTLCPYQKSSRVAAVSIGDCKCIPGLYLEEEGKDTEEDIVHTPRCIGCPVGTHSLFGATSIEDCLCMPGWVFNGTNCIPCPPASYKTMIGNEIQCTPCPR